jgi:protease-4
MSDSQQPGGSGSGTKPSVPPDLWAQAATESGAASAARPKAALEPGWERATLEKLAFAALHEQRSARRWKIFFRLTWLLVAVLVAWAALDQSTSGASKLAPHTAVVDIKGEIAAGAEASAELVVAAMRSAFEDEGSQAWCC